MSQEHKKHHIVGYGTYALILLGLLILTLVTVAVTNVELGPLTVTVALLIASVKAALVLVYFMHLKFDNRIFALMVGAVLLLMVVVFVITFLDYSFR
ncbi:MAG: cytochrome-c oxidase [Bacteroidales bacterium]|nr:cytochrome-c oxidase [Bacteroidales bacterium]